MNGYLERAGHVRPKGAAAHHIVAGRAKAAERAREILKKFEIGINDADNGVFLPGNTKSPNPLDASVHSKVHTEEYYQAVEEMLEQVNSREGAIRALGQIRDMLLRGEF